MVEPRFSGVLSWTLALCCACAGPAPRVQPTFRSIPTGSPTAPAVAPPPSSTSAPNEDCARARAAALELATDGDRSMKIDPDRSIGRYRSALELDPGNHRILWKLAWAQEKIEDWTGVEATLARAAELAPDFATYWASLGHALIMQARAGKGDFERAKEPLQRCVEKDPNFAECYYLLGEAYRWTDQEQAALESYSKAIERDSRIVYFYIPLAELYLSFQMPKRAEAVLEEGTRLGIRNQLADPHLYAAYVLMALAAQYRGDEPALLAAFNPAQAYEKSGDPELIFELGMAFASASPTRYKEKVTRLLSKYYTLACSPVRAPAFLEPCATASAVLQNLGAPPALASRPASAIARESQPQRANSALPAGSSGLVCPPVVASYEPRELQGGDVHLPSVPELPKQPGKTGDAYSIGGLSHFLRTRVHSAEVAGKRVTLQGYVTKTNLADAPGCAIHPSARADPPGCRAAVPAFWLGDTPHAAATDSIKVLGWASSYAEVYEAIQAFDSGTGNTRHVDRSWAVEVPNPLPSAGAHVRVSATYSRAFTKTSGGFEANARMGLLTYDKIEYLEPPSALGTLPGVKRRTAN